MEKLNLVTDEIHFDVEHFHLVQNQKNKLDSGIVWTIGSPQFGFTSMRKQSYARARLAAFPGAQVRDGGARQRRQRRHTRGTDGGSEREGRGCELVIASRMWSG